MSLLEFFTLSCVNDSLWLLLYVILHRPDYLQVHPYLAACLILSGLFISPFVFGWLLGYFSSNKRIASALKIFGWKAVRSIPTAWDYWFGLEKQAFVSVTLTNGSKVLGYYGSKSYAGDGTNEQRDIYFEKVYTGGKSGLRLVDRTAGILINREQIAYIEFYTPE